MPAITESKYLVQAGWTDVPHINQQTRERLLREIPPHLRDARTEGEPSLGAGAIYPVELSQILCDPVQIPAYWPRCYALDVGWNRTAVAWGALNREEDCWYLFTEHYRGKAEIAIHANAIKARGEWIPGLFDPGARSRSLEDGRQVLTSYNDLGCKLSEAKCGLEAGIYETWLRLSTGRLKVFRTMMNWQAEYRLYRRDEKGNVVKEFDHLMDCMRYIVLSGRGIAVPVPVEKDRIIPASAAHSKTGY